MRRTVLKAIALSAVLALTSGSLYAADKPANPKKQTTLNLYLSAKEVPAFIEKNKDKVVFIDVRTPAEIEFVGHAEGIDKNIPIAYRDYTKYDEKKHRYGTFINQKFIDQVDALVKSKGLTKEDAKVILMCRSGDRSAASTNLLAKQGYKNVYTVIDGFEGNKDKNGKRTVDGWKNAGNPWTYKNKKEIMDFSKPVKVIQ